MQIQANVDTYQSRTRQNKYKSQKQASRNSSWDFVKYKKYKCMYMNHICIVDDKLKKW